MTNAGPIGIHFDGCVFGRQTHGGISRVFLSLFRELSAVEDLQLHLHLEDGVTVPGLPVGLRVGHISPPFPLRPRRLFRKVNDYLRLLSEKRYFKSYGRGVFHSTYYTTSPSPRLKQVLTLHDMIYEDYPEYFENHISRERHIRQKKRCIEAADAIVCVSAATRDRLEFHYPLVLENKLVTVIHNGCGKSDSQSLCPREHQECFSRLMPYLLHVGSRHPHKNFDRLIEAMHLSDLPGLNLVSVGGGDWSEQERNLIGKLGLAARIHNFPMVTEEELEAAYEQSAVVVVPSIDEGFGLPLLEALSSGCTVACSRSGSLPEVGGDVPYYFDPFDVDEMADAIGKALSAGNGEESARRGVKRAASFSWQKCGAGYAQLYRNLCS